MARLSRRCLDKGGVAFRQGLPSADFGVDRGAGGVGQLRFKVGQKRVKEAVVIVEIEGDGGRELGIG